jgi:DNA-binding transcriptional regulator YdaS (Cro superfamily)
MGTNTATAIANPANESTVIGYAALAEATRIIGGQSALATAVGKKQGHVQDWLNATGAPADICPAIEHATDEQVKCEDLRPDLNWVRGDSGEILGYLTPVENATASYVRASLHALVREQANANLAAEVRLGYLRGILHRLEPEQRKETEDFYKFDSLIGNARLTDESAFADFAGEIANSAAANDPEAFYIHAYGITHGIESDDLRDTLLVKHGFKTSDGTPFPGRHAELDALWAEVQRHLESVRAGRDQAAAAERVQRGGALALKASSVIRQPNPIEAYGGNIKNWRPNPDATVEDCLNDAAFMLDEAFEIFNALDMTTLGGAGVRLVSLSRELVSATHSKLMAFDRQQQVVA